MTDTTKIRSDTGAGISSDNTAGEKVNPAPSASPEASKEAQKEVGGRNGPEPTRFGDWEKNGIISDF